MLLLTAPSFICFRKLNALRYVSSFACLCFAVIAFLMIVFLFTDSVCICSANHKSCGVVAVAQATSIEDNPAMFRALCIFMFSFSHVHN